MMTKAILTEMSLKVVWGYVANHDTAAYCCLLLMVVTVVVMVMMMAIMMLMWITCTVLTEDDGDDGDHDVDVAHLEQSGRWGRGNAGKDTEEDTHIEPA